MFSTRKTTCFKALIVHLTYAVSKEQDQDQDLLTLLLLFLSQNLSIFPGHRVNKIKDGTT